MGRGRARRAHISATQISHKYLYFAKYISSLQMRSMGWPLLTYQLQIYFSRCLANISFQVSTLQCERAIREAVGSQKLKM